MWNQRQDRKLLDGLLYASGSELDKPIVGQDLSVLKLTDRLSAGWFFVDVLKAATKNSVLRDERRGSNHSFEPGYTWFDSSVAIIAIDVVMHNQV